MRFNELQPAAPADRLDYGMCRGTALPPCPFEAGHIPSCRGSAGTAGIRMPCRRAVIKTKPAGLADDPDRRRIRRGGEIPFRWLNCGFRGLDSLSPEIDLSLSWSISG